MQKAIEQLQQLHEDMANLARDFQQLHQRLHQVMGELQSSTQPKAASYGSPMRGFNAPSPFSNSPIGNPARPMNPVTQNPNVGRQQTGSAMGAASTSYFSNLSKSGGTVSKVAPGMPPISAGPMQSTQQGIRPDGILGRQSESYGRL